MTEIINSRFSDLSKFLSAAGGLVAIAYTFMWLARDSEAKLLGIPLEVRMPEEKVAVAIFTRLWTPLIIYSVMIGVLLSAILFLARRFRPLAKALGNREVTLVFSTVSATVTLILLLSVLGLEAVAVRHIDPASFEAFIAFLLLDEDLIALRSLFFFCHVMVTVAAVWTVMGEWARRRRFAKLVVIYLAALLIPLVQTIPRSWVYLQQQHKLTPATLILKSDGAKSESVKIESVQIESVKIESGRSESEKDRNVKNENSSIDKNATAPVPKQISGFLVFQSDVVYGLLTQEGNCEDPNNDDCRTKVRMIPRDNLSAIDVRPEKSIRSALQSFHYFGATNSFGPGVLVILLLVPFLLIMAALPHVSRVLDALDYPPIAVKSIILSCTLLLILAGLPGGVSAQVVPSRKTSPAAEKKLPQSVTWDFDRLIRSFAPDKIQIAARIAGVFRGANVDQNGGDVWLLKRSGSGPERLTSRSDVSSALRGPDGKTLALLSGGALSVLVPGSDARLIASNDEWNTLAAWHSDTGFLVLSDREAFLVPVSTGQPESLPDLTDEEVGKLRQLASFSASGERLTADTCGNEWCIKSHVPGKEPMVIHRSSTPIFRPVWAGRDQILFVSRPE